MVLLYCLGIGVAWCSVGSARDTNRRRQMFWKTMRCSFCRRPDSQVAKLVAGPAGLFGRAYICDRCAAQAIEIIEAAS